MAEANFQQLPKGLGSYLDGVVPEDIALSAGAFSMAMQQIKNIKNVNFEKFAQVASSLEVVNKNLPLVNGTDVPVDVTAAEAASKMLSLGSGPQGSYTMSDFFGCASGLPYNWLELQRKITNTQTTKLQNIYSELFLAVTWEAASISVQYTDNGGIYTVTGVTISDSGGGYNRGSAVAPTITILGGSGATAVCTIGTNSLDLGSNGNGTYGRVTSVTLTSAGITSGTIPTATIQCPPTATLAVQVNGNKSTSGVNTAAGTAGWPSMDTVVQAYITQANQEIIDITQTNFNNVNILNTIYDSFGTQLEIEQSARYLALNPVPVPRDRFLTQYPTNITNFVNNVGSNYAKFTKPHMHSQTIEALANLDTLGGQSLVALMRQERNKERLEKLPVPLDNVIPDELLLNQSKALIANGTIELAEPDSGIDSYTIPASLIQEIDNSVITPQPSGFYNTTNDQYYITPSTTLLENTQPIENILKGNIVTGAVTPIGFGQPLDTGNSEYLGSLAGSTFQNILNPELNIKYTSSTLLPNQLSTQEAINQVIECNCDCWVD